MARFYVGDPAATSAIIAGNLDDPTATSTSTAGLGANHLAQEALAYGPYRARSPASLARTGLRATKALTDSAVLDLLDVYLTINTVSGLF